MNGVIHGYEIKSESDTLARLHAQTSAYNRALDRVTMVCGSNHLLAVDRMIPHWWGIQVAEMNEGMLRLSPVRTEGDNPDPEPFAQAQLLWRDEALAALEARDLAAGHRSKPRRALWRLLAVHIDAAELGALVRDTLRSRRDWRVALPLA